jgi:hypothetical protein
MSWGSGVVLGLAIAAVSIVPLWFYLGKSPVWAERERECPSPLTITRPRLLDTVCTAIPYAFGSQRRGHPNLARALGVHNLNESAGGFAGLATLVWLVPQAWRARRTNGRILFLFGLATIGFLAAFEFAPVVNLFRTIPVLRVTDQRRLTLWVAFALVILGGFGLDHVALIWPRWVRRWWVSLGIASATTLVLGTLAVYGAESWLRNRAHHHYTGAAAATEGADVERYTRRAERQVRETLEVIPRVLLLASAELAGLVVLASLAHRATVSWTATRGMLLALSLVELFGFGIGLNPAIDRDDDRPQSAVVARLRAVVGDAGRVLGIGEELPPNVSMRYGLADPRNYDSVELARSLAWFAPLYESGREAESSRGTITWSGVLRARERLEEAAVRAVVAAVRPPAELAARVERVGGAWVAWLDAQPLVSAASATGTPGFKIDNGLIDVTLCCSRDDLVVVRETFDPSWRADVDGIPAAVEPYRDTFLSVRVGAGDHTIRLVYDPPEVRFALTASLAALAASLVLLSCSQPIRSVRFLSLGLGSPRTIGLESIV